MRTESFRGRDFITLLEYSREEVETILDLALDLKRRFAAGEPHDHLLRAKTLFMIFYNQSLRTRNSFEAGMTQLGGHAHYLDPEKIYTPALPGREVAYTTERVSDVARVLSRMGHAIAIRCYGDPVDWIYGGANEIIRNFAYWADIPVLNMEDDKYHPFQALADILTVQEKFGTFKRVKFVMSWAYSPSVHKPRAVPQSAIIAATLMGMDVVLAHPKGMELDEEVLGACQKNAQSYGGSFQIVNEFEEALKGAQVVYPKSWTAVPLFKPPVGEDNPDKAKEIFEANKDWICDKERLALADEGAIYLHCLPADRGFEVTDEVIDGPQSVVFDEAENRLHVQKAVMALTMR
ncbi:ornithine carbamoyltransferase [Candidatus Hakubella thermalkaliphila]|uniref:Ornithine carbamoyltransferase n=3 Tax=Candidatus Hakubella thermalkaliphila TaxID=2754717 RepID=A0A6V8PR69_9ACTN|nr:N-acetylornithine carbamoyltransferase [Candidatus Hakubella thermalkaliphila]GFP21468.1 ornithine carbamoyltransferase [Candidatus Hakubella thermalkaliphila]GFP24603.1 ornithine carbamoyltransferase [Candidatus Hakubella thermalkaliphila]GFP34550.1 ornithine carbamoyltransferase [Candidatus Hakubella thermalkaliphila]